jgi:hypothetical protein
MAWIRDDGNTTSLSITGAEDASGFLLLRAVWTGRGAGTRWGSVGAHRLVVHYVWLPRAFLGSRSSNWTKICSGAFLTKWAMMFNRPPWVVPRTSSRAPSATGDSAIDASRGMVAATPSIEKRFVPT